MDGKGAGKTVLHREASARLWGELRGRISSFNAGQIISLAAIVLFSGLFLWFTASVPSLGDFLKPIVVVLLVLFVLVIIGGFVRNWRTKPEDEFSPVITKFMHQHRAIEIRGLPTSAVTTDFLGGISALIFLENPPPEGLIEGDVTDDKAIRMLSDQEKAELQQRERREIEQHKKNVQETLKGIKPQSADAKAAVPPLGDGGSSV